MKVYGNYNNVSEEVLQKIPELKGTALFELLTGVPNPDSVQRETLPMLYGKIQLSTKFKIRDGKKIVDIVLSDDWDEKGQPVKPRLFVAGMGETHFLGTFLLQEGNIADEELYEVLWLSPERQGSPFSDAKTKPLFKLVNKEQESKETTKNVDDLRKALEIASKMSDDEVVEFMTSQNKNYSPAEARSAVNEMARMDHKKFTTLHGDPLMKVKAEIKRAIDSGVIVYDAATRNVTMGNTTLFTMKDDVETLEGIATWTESAANGKKVLEGIRKQLTKAEATS